MPALNADAAGSGDPGLPPPLDEGSVAWFRPFRLRVVAWTLGAALCGLYLFGWFALPAHLRALFTAWEIATLLLILAVILLVLGALAGSSVRAAADGLRVRNGLRVHVVTWPRIRAVVLRSGDPWALCLLNSADGSPYARDLDPETLMLMGIQRNDGERAVQAVADLRRLQGRFSRR